MNSKTSDDMTIQAIDENNTIIVTRPRGDKYSDDALASMILESNLVRNIVKEKPMTKDWNEDLKLLTNINNKITAMKMDARMSYDLFREKFDELSLQNKSPGHIEDAIYAVKGMLTPTKNYDFSQSDDFSPSMAKKIK
jgi:hypothetical protein